MASKHPKVVAERKTVNVRTKDDAGPMGVLAAGLLGVGILCTVSAMAMDDLNRSSFMTLEPLNVIDLAVSNLNTSA